MYRLFLGVIVGLGAAVLFSTNVSALSSGQKLFISADNTFYTYVRGGETVSAAFLRVNQDEPFDTVRGDVTVTVDGPGIEQQKCVIPANVAIGSGCRFGPIDAPQTGIWKIQFVVPSDAKTYYEVSPAVKWAKNLFSWDITVKSGSSEQQGRTWTERYAIRQPAAESYSEDLVHYYISEDGYIYRATSLGYHGQISTLSADSVGIRKGNECVSVYQSTEVGDKNYSPALGTCGNAYKLFFEEPAGLLPAKAEKWDGDEDWVRPNISRPKIAELHFTSDKSIDQQSGVISFYLRNFIGQYQVKVDVDGDGSFDGQHDVVLNQQMKKLSNGLQQIRFSGTDKTGQIISPSQKIGIKVDITKVAEIHLVAADVEGRTGGLELVRLSGDNAPTTGVCWNDRELGELATELMTETLDGRKCPDSTEGVHAWAYADSSWGNARFIDDWVYASAKLEGSNEIVYPEDDEAAAIAQQNAMGQVVFAVAACVIVIAGIVIAVVLRKRRNKNDNLPPPPPVSPVQAPQTPQQPSPYQQIPPQNTPVDPYPQRSPDDRP